MKKTTICIVVALLCLNFKVKAQSQNDNLKPLKIGDTVPEAVWNLSLQVVNNPNGKRAITLKDYKEKLLILDFWATWCGSCIRAMPRMDSLNKIFNKQLIILPVTTDQQQKVESFSGRNPVLASLKINSVVGANQLKKLFPHTMVPHEVWIMNGVVKAITHSDFVTTKEIQKIFQSNIIDLPQKEDMLNFDANNPSLFKMGEGIDSSFLYRSIFTAFKPGLPSLRGIQIGKEKANWKVYAINSSILQLYNLAFRQIAALPQESIEVNIPNTKLHQPNLAGNELDNWNQQNLYCYELNLPMSTEKHLWETVRQDLNRYLGLNGRMEIRKGKAYFVLEPANPIVNQNLN